MDKDRPADQEFANPAAVADANHHVRQEIASLEASVARRVRHLWRWLAVPAGAMAGWLIVRRRGIKRGANTR